MSASDAPVWVVEGPEFRRTAFRPTTVRGRPAEYAFCQELVDGRWEGFAAVRFPPSPPTSTPGAPAPP